MTAAIVISSCLHTRTHKISFGISYGCPVSFTLKMPLKQLTGLLDRLELVIVLLPRMYMKCPIKQDADSHLTMATMGGPLPGKGTNASTSSADRCRWRTIAPLPQQACPDLLGLRQHRLRRRHFYRLADDLVFLFQIHETLLGGQPIW